MILADTSLNGTFVNGTLVGKGNETTVPNGASNGEWDGATLLRRGSWFMTICEEMPIVSIYCILLISIVIGFSVHALQCQGSSGWSLALGRVGVLDTSACIVFCHSVCLTCSSEYVVRQSTHFPLFCRRSFLVVVASRQSSQVQLSDHV